MPQAQQQVSGTEQHLAVPHAGTVSRKLDPSCMKKMHVRILCVLINSAKQGTPFLNKGVVRIRIGEDFKKLHEPASLARDGFQSLLDGDYITDEGDEVSATRAGEKLHTWAQEAKPALFAISDSPTPELEEALAKAREELAMTMQ
jgi:hypothetical protein